MKIKILIVVADFYKDISKNLIKAAVRELVVTKIGNIDYKIIKVPGSFEIPIIISKNIKKYEGFIALGCIIKGETPHFDYISKTTIEAIMKLSLQYKKPIGNGILTCLNISQAKARSLSNPGKKNKGREASKALLSVLGILKNESK